MEQARILLGRIKQKRPEKSILLTGLRGAGKTVLLNEIERLASGNGYRTIAVEAHEQKSLGVLIVPYLRRLLFDLDRVAGAGDKVKRGLAVLKSFLGALQVTVMDVTFGLDIEPEKGAADGGDLEIDLPNLFIAIGEAAEDRKSPVAILIDEIQYLTQKELSALIMAMHKVQQRQLPLVLLGAGLPVLPGLAGEAKSYAERLFDFPDVGALSEEDAGKALQAPAHAVGVVFEPAALTEVFRLTKGYPYFVQEWGYQAWNLAAASPITVQIVKTSAANNFLGPQSPAIQRLVVRRLKSVLILGRRDDANQQKHGEHGHQARLRHGCLRPLDFPLTLALTLASPSSSAGSGR